MFSNPFICVPEYIPEVRTIVDDPNIKWCNFYEHATCVSYVEYYFDPRIVQCVPACFNSKYTTTAIQVQYPLFYITIKICVLILLLKGNNFRNKVIILKVSCFRIFNGIVSLFHTTAFLIIVTSFIRTAV